MFRSRRPLNASIVQVKSVVLTTLLICVDVVGYPAFAESNEGQRQFWAFRELRRPARPNVKSVDRVRTTVDAFVLSKLEDASLSFAPDADRTTLVRRAYLDLIGLPPRPGEVEAFLTDIQPGAYERLIDRLLARLNEERRQLYPEDSRLEARMQLEAESVLNLSGESEATRRLYGLDDKMTGDYGTRCLMARRLVEAGVRFVTVTSPREGRIAGQPWDNHSHINADIPKIAHRVDRPSAALIKDLRQRGLLDDTIVIWAGEFGRLPISEGTTGRDHNPHAFTILLAGGGFKAGHIHGATDKFGYKGIRDRVSCPDLLATVLHQLGRDHDRLSYRHAGREETLTDSTVSNAKVVHGLIA